MAAKRRESISDLRGGPSSPTAGRHANVVGIGHNPISWLLSVVATAAALLAASIGASEAWPDITDQLSTTRGRGLVALFVAIVAAIALHWEVVREMLLEIEYGNVIAAGVAILGYMYDHNKTLREEKRTAQRERIVNQNHKLLVPLTNNYHTVWLSIAYFIDEQMDAHPPSEEDMAKAEEIMERKLLHPLFERPCRFRNAVPIVFAQGICFNWDELLKPGTRSVFSVPHVTSVKSEVPDYLMKALQECEKPKSRLWRDWESMVRHELYPAIKECADIIRQHSDLLETLPPEQLQTRYGSSGTGYGHTWMAAPRGWFYSVWLGYTRSWERTLASWDEGDYSRVRCTHDHPIGMFIFNLCAQQKLSKLEAELIGASAMSGAKL